MNRKSLSAVLLDVLVFAASLVIFWITLGYGMDLALGRPRNEMMDKAIIVGAMAFILLLVVWYFRSGQYKYDWDKEEDRH